MRKSVRYSPEVREGAFQMSDFTYISIWTDFVYLAFVVDVFARRVMGRKVSAFSKTDFVLGALEQALHARRPAQAELIHHNDRGVQYVSIR